jgi:short subunit dehydrogenase-like uncharacterized protein
LTSGGTRALHYEGLAVSWGIYGATGVTGRLIVAEAVARGHRPVLLGRSEVTLRPLAEEWGLEWRAFELVEQSAEVAMGNLDPTDMASEELTAPLGGLAVVLNAAGPFSVTVASLLDSCLAAGVSYLDLSNEFDTVARAYDLHDRAVAADITVVPGVGFGTVAGDAVLRHALAALPDAVVVRVALLADNAPGGPATRDSVLAVLANGSAWFGGGELRRGRLGSGIRRISTPLGSRTLVPVATGDLAAAQRTLAGSSAPVATSASVALSVPPPLLRLLLPFVELALRTEVLQRVLRLTDPAARVVGRWRHAQRDNRALRRQQRAARTRVGGTTSNSRNGGARTFASHAWAQATAVDGRWVFAWLDAGEGYAFSSSAAALAVERVLAGTPPGAWTPSQAFGDDFVLAVSGTRLAMLDQRGSRDAASQP